MGEVSHLTATERTVDTCVVIVEAELEGETTVMGALADSVHEVLDLASGDIEPPGMGRQGDKFIIILDIDKVLSSDELALVAQAGSLAVSTGVGEALQAAGA